jgi:glycolate oxidase FAD binding subunit
MPVIEPANAGEVRDAVREALARRAPMAIEGHGTRGRWGHAVAAASRLVLRELSGILRYEPSELVMRARAGTPLADVVAALAERGQHLAFEPVHPGAGTIGGAFLVNDGGPRRYVAGAARDHLLGFTAVSGRGEVFKSGGSVIKNVTGYDLSKLLAGSFGTLAVAADLTFKCLPAPRTQVSYAIPVADAQSASDQLIALAQSDLDASALAYLPAQSAAALAACVNGIRPQPQVFARIEGSEASVAAREQWLRAMAPEAVAVPAPALWAAIRDVDPILGEEPDGVNVRISLPPAAMVALVRREPFGPDACWYADHGGGRIWIALPGERAVAGTAAIRAFLATAGGTAAVVSANEPLKRAAGAFTPAAPAHQALAARVKASFDPGHVLNPGRLQPPPTA